MLVQGSAGNVAPGWAMGAIIRNYPQMLQAMSANNQHILKKRKKKIYEISVNFILVSIFGIKEWITKN